MRSKIRNVSVRHFAPTSGYGFSDEGREKLSLVFAEALDAEAAICSPSPLMSGTHDATALFGLLRPGDGLLSVTGRPYDTFANVIDSEQGFGSLKEWGIRYSQQPFADHKIEADRLLETLSEDSSIKIVYIQRSAGTTSVLQFLFPKSAQLRTPYIKNSRRRSFSWITATVNLLNSPNSTTLGADMIAGLLDQESRRGPCAHWRVYRGGESTWLIKSPYRHIGARSKRRDRLLRRLLSAVFPGLFYGAAYGLPGADGRNSRFLRIQN